MTVTYQVFNSIDSKAIVAIRMPWDYRKAIKGFYSSFWRECRKSWASSVKIDKRFLRAEVTRDKQISDRLEIVFPSGLKLNTPFDLNEKDFKIINLHLEALELSI